MNAMPSNKARYSGRVRRALLLSAVFFCSVLSARSQIQLPDGNGKQDLERVCTLRHELCFLQGRSPLTEARNERSFN